MQALHRGKRKSRVPAFGGCGAAQGTAVIAAAVSQSVSQPGKKQTLLVPVDAGQCPNGKTEQQGPGSAQTEELEFKDIEAQALLLHHGSSGNSHACIPLTLCNESKSSVGSGANSIWTSVQLTLICKIFEDQSGGPTAWVLSIHSDTGM